MRKLFLAILLLALPLKAVEQVELFITVTNTPVTGDYLTLNATTRTWTNGHSATTILTNLVDHPIANSTTNLYFNLSAHIITERPVVIWTDTNALRLIFPVGTAITASESGEWASFTYTTNDITQAYGVRVPITIEASTNRAKIMSLLTDAFEHSTNEFLFHWPAMGQLAGLTNNNALTGSNTVSGGLFTAPYIVNAALISGIVSALTNGYWTNATFDSPISTNGVNYGNAFRSPGTGTSSEQFGTSAAATGDSSVALGEQAAASGDNAVAIGKSSVADINDIVIGSGAEGGFGSSIVIGTGAAVNATNGIAIGNGAIVGANDTNSIAIGNSVTTTKTNQILLGSSSYIVEVPGTFLVSGTSTNGTHTGATKMGVSGGSRGSLAFSRYDNATLVNNDNLIDIGGSSYVKVSGPSAAYAICNITNTGSGGVFDGLRVLVQKNDSFTLTIKDESGTTVGVAANRIYTGTGGDLTITNNPGFAEFIYDAATSRWGLIHKSN